MSHTVSWLGICVSIPLVSKNILAEDQTEGEFWLFEKKIHNSPVKSTTSAF